MDDSYGLDAWLTRFDGFMRDVLAGLVADGLAHYDAARAAWILHSTGEPFEVRDVDAAPFRDRSKGPARSGPEVIAGRKARFINQVTQGDLDQEIDLAVNRYEARQPPASPRDSIIYRALAAADASPDGTTTRWREQLREQLEATAPREWYEITYAAGDPSRRPVIAYDEDAALGTARRMSGSGEQVNVTHVASDNRDRPRRLIGSFRDRQPLPSPAPGRHARPWPDLAPPPADRIAAAADIAGPPVRLPPGDPRGTARQFPGGISPLPDTAMSGGPVRPTRLLHADGAPLECHPAGPDGPAWTGTAAGVVPAEGNLAPGWLQVVSRGDGSLVALHPARVSPRGVDPYAWLPFRDQRRFSGFDTAEAAGQTAARLQARFVDRGDQIRAGNGEVREVTDVTWDNDSDLWITTTGHSGDMSSMPAGSGEPVEVMIPARHPAEDTPHAARLFAPPPRAAQGDPAQRDPAALPRRKPAPRPGPAGDADALLEADITGLRQAMGYLRGQGAADGPGTEAPGPAGWAPSISVTEALQRGRAAVGPVAGRPTAAGPPWAAMPAQPGWQASVGMTGALQHAQDRAASAIRGLSQNRPWRWLRALTADSRRLAADASAGRLRFGDPAVALRIWRAIWARTCELTCDLAATMMDGLRQGSNPWYAARTLHHAAAEGIAHARGWLPRGMRLPIGSYEPPGSRRVSAASARMRADAAARLHEHGAGPLSQLEFPGPLQGVTARANPGRRDRQRAARTAAARARRAAAQAPRPGPR